MDTQNISTIFEPSNLPMPEDFLPKNIPDNDDGNVISKKIFI